MTQWKKQNLQISLMNYVSNNDIINFFSSFNSILVWSVSRIQLVSSFSRALTRNLSRSQTENVKITFELRFFIHSFTFLEREREAFWKAELFILRHTCVLVSKPIPAVFDRLFVCYFNILQHFFSYTCVSLNETRKKLARNFYFNLVLIILVVSNIETKR